MSNISPEKLRLSDRILMAMELAVDQEDAQIAEILHKALDLSMTRNTGGGEFIERRDYPPHVEAVLDKLSALQQESA